MKESREVHGEAELPADPWTGLVLPSEQGEGETETITNRVLAPNQALQLPSAQPTVVRNAAVDFAPEGQSTIEVAQQREASGVDMATRGLNTYHTCARIAGE